MARTNSNYKLCQTLLVSIINQKTLVAFQLTSFGDTAILTSSYGTKCVSLVQLLQKNYTSYIGSKLKHFDRTEIDSMSKILYSYLTLFTNYITPQTHISFSSYDRWPINLGLRHLKVQVFFLFLVLTF